MEFIRENNRIIYVVDGKTLAYVTFPKLNDNTVIINHTVVDPSLRGQGIASKLLEEVVKYLQEYNKGLYLYFFFVIIKERFVIGSFFYELLFNLF